MLVVGLGVTMPVRAAEPLTFGFVAPLAGSPFFDDIAKGCVARAIQISGEGRPVRCLYAAPGLVDGKGAAQSVPAAATADVSLQARQQSGTPPDSAAPAPVAPLAAPDPRSEAQIIAGLVAARVDGIAVSPSSDPAVATAIRAAVDAGVPVVTVDTDAPGSGRAAAIGTNARDFGRALGASLRRWKPKGGKFVIIATDPQQASMAERIYGVRDALGLGWSELVESPVVTSGEATDAVGKIDHLLSAYYDIDAIISVGAWPMLNADAWRDMVSRYKTRIDKADVVLVMADALPSQKDLVRQGLGHVLVGQKPEDMGGRAIDLLLQLTERHRIPEVVYVGFETFTRLDLVRPSN
jgi:ribose transport system substrate-binding protein